MQKKNISTNDGYVQLLSRGKNREREKSHTIYLIAKNEKVRKIFINIRWKYITTVHCTCYAATQRCNTLQKGTRMSSDER